MRLSHHARGAVSAENARRAMMLRGTTPNGYRLWDPFEVGNLVDVHPDYPAAMALNIRRTRPAHYGKAGRLGITKPPAPPWSTNELLRLHRLYPRATKDELLASLPSRTWGAICRRARSDGYRRPLRQIKPTGLRLLDQILERARQKNISMADLDAFTASGGYFSRRKWRRGALKAAVVAKAVGLLGGRLRARPSAG